MAEQRNNRRERFEREPQEFEQSIIDLARVTRVMAGGKRMRFRACVVIGDKKGRLGFGIAKGADVTLAVNKAVTKAKKSVLTIPINNGTIYHALDLKYKAARLMMKPAPEGTGVMAGGAVRQALELSGVGNVVAKIYGSKNKINNIRVLFKALEELRKPTIKQRAVKQAKKEVPIEAVAAPVEESK